MEITRRIEFDAGHRIPSHQGQCRNVHGHRYVLEATFAGPVRSAFAKSKEGMVEDFGDLKKLLYDLVHSAWDHAFLCYEGDAPMVAALMHLLDTKVVMLPFVPTAENLAAEIFRLLDVHLADKSYKAVRVRLYETPNAYAEVTSDVSQS